MTPNAVLITLTIFPFAYAMMKPVPVMISGQNISFDVFCHTHKTHQTKLINGTQSHFQVGCYGQRPTKTIECVDYAIFIKIWNITEYTKHDIYQQDKNSKYHWINWFGSCNTSCCTLPNILCLLRCSPPDKIYLQASWILDQIPGQNLSEMYALVWYMLQKIFWYMIKIKMKYLPEYLGQLLGEKPAKLWGAHHVDQKVCAGIQQEEEFAFNKTSLDIWWTGSCH